MWAGKYGGATSGFDEEPCAERILSTFARRAYRRPVTDADVQPLLDLYAAARRLDKMQDLAKLGAHIIKMDITKESEIVSAVNLIRTNHGGVDLLVMATHGLTGLDHALMGSVAERVVRVCPCPVMTVKAAPPTSDPPKADASNVGAG